MKSRCTVIDRRTWDCRITSRNMCVFDVIGPHLCCVLPKHIGYKTGFSCERSKKGVWLPPKASGLTGVGRERGFPIYFFYCISCFGKIMGDTSTISHKRACRKRISRRELRVIDNRYFHTTTKKQMLLVILGKFINRCVLRFIGLRVPRVNKSNFFFLTLNSIDGLTFIQCFVPI